MDLKLILLSIIITTIECQECEPDYVCPDGTAISNDVFCDGVRDCDGGEDEHVDQCGRCYDHKFECSDGFCIDSYDVCNGRNDCDDGSDEEASLCGPPCTLECPADYAMCESQCQCRRISSFCDGYPHCRDGSDESECDFPCQNDCPANYFRCSSTCQCIEMNWVCDGHNDCVDGSDETLDECDQVECLICDSSVLTTQRGSQQTVDDHFDENCANGIVEGNVTVERCYQCAMGVIEYTSRECEDGLYTESTTKGLHRFCMSKDDDFTLGCTNFLERNSDIPANLDISKYEICVCDTDRCLCDACDDVTDTSGATHVLDLHSLRSFYAMMMFLGILLM